MRKEHVISSIPIYHIMKFNFKMVQTCNINHPLLECLIINDGPWHSIVLSCLVGWFLNVLINYQVISRTGPNTECLTILRATTHESWETMTSISAGHIILTPTQPVESGRPQRN